MSDFRLPSYCDACRSCCLVPADMQADVLCDRCGTTVSVVPGALYRATDLELFARVRAVIDGQKFTVRELLHIQALLNEGSERLVGTGRLLERIMDALPEMVFLQVHFPFDLTVQAKALGMLSTIVQANARARRTDQ